ncbi:MAG: hypothetical protein ACK56I_14625, partial [bacterium]
GYFTHTWTYKYLPLAIGNVVILSSPFAIAFLSYHLFGDKITSLDLKSVLISFIGLSIMAFSRPSTTIAQTHSDI